VADVVAFDELVSDEILALVNGNAERIPVGRRAHGCRHHEDDIHHLVIDRAREGRAVVRLKGGDPLVFGRGGEEAQALATAGIPFEIVPGISAALGAASALGIPLTHRECASSVTFVTAHAAGDRSTSVVSPNPSRYGTVVYYMGLGRVEATCNALMESGRRADTPGVVVSRATLPGERVVTGTIANLGLLVDRAALVAPALLIVGEVVGRRVEPSVKR
jgi:uroporphyrin-III C-methyltransferase/precorrin-2 dehydrogenase/sirohydrochlorin ferrochelatase